MEIAQKETLEIKKTLENIYKFLWRHKEYINRLNVFPVPDGDTGLNMTLTIQGALADLPDYSDNSISPGEYLKVFAENMLLNSRGCSGVILSLYCQGIAQVLVNSDFSAGNVFKALEKGYLNAYEGTQDPQEGTILTLMFELKEKYGQVMLDEENPVVILINCIPHLREVLKKTPEMLPALKQAGVVDAGGAGFIIILEGIEREINFKQSTSNVAPVSIILNTTKTIRKIIQSSSSNIKYSHLGTLLLNVSDEKINNTKLRNIINDFQHHSGNILNKSKKKLSKEAILKDLKEMESSWNPQIKYRYCTEFVLKSNKISSQDEMKQLIGGYGDSMIVLNSNDTYKVHIHTNKPDSVFSDVSKYGELVFTKVDDMKKQHRNFISHDTIEYERERSIFCIISGEGFKRILEDLGANDIFCYGKKKPSVEQLVKAINQLKTKNIIAAPDDKDILMSLKYAASLSKSNVHIVESKSVISLISMLMGASNDININNMSFINKLNDIRYCGISRAIRETAAENNTIVKKKDFFTMYDGKIIHSGKDIKEVVVKSIEKLAQKENLVTLYKGIPAKRHNNLLPELKKIFRDLEFEEYYGGQYQFYYYLTFE
jgi:dihydroxyacetone kinase-like predicted kinase